METWEREQKTKIYTVNGATCPFTHKNSSERRSMSMSEATA